MIASGDALISREHLADDFLEEARARQPGGAGDDRPATAPAPTLVAAQDAAAVSLAVEAAKGNISEASKRLGISRNTLYRKLRWNVSA